VSSFVSWIYPWIQEDQPLTKKFDSNLGAPSNPASDSTKEKREQERCQKMGVKKPYRKNDYLKSS
jgi:hypothetical protein